MKPLKLVSILLLLAFVSSAAIAQDIPLQNWTPAPWGQSGHSKVATTAFSSSFMPMPPCRVYDSRGSSILPGLTSRTINIDGGPCAGIPSGAAAYSLNITAFGSAATGSYEFITLYPTGSTRPTVSTMNFLTGTQTSNAAVVPAGTSGDINIYTTFTTHFVLDINGYYASALNPADGFLAMSATGTGVTGVSTSGWGVLGNSSTNYGVVGASNGPATVAGVVGTSANGRGVFGISTSYNGVWAESTNWDAIFANGGRDGAYIVGARFGIIGRSLSTAPDAFGIIGSTASTGADSAGILGEDSQGRVEYNANIIPSGVRGESRNNIGVSGLSSWIGVYGVRRNPDGSAGAGAYLGYSTYGMYAIGNTAATGTKSFVEPHAADPQKVIKYVSLEGPEAGTYFRGRGTLSGGRAVIEVPEDFRMVTDSEGLTVHLTPIGRLAIVAVVSADLNNIVVESNRDVEFSYIVYGVRKAFRDFRPIQQEEGEFMPMSADSVMPSSLPVETQRRLIETGIYNQDGTVNLDTAERLGWTKIWREHSRAQQQ